MLLGLQHQPVQRLSNPWRSLENAGDGVAAEAGEYDAFDLAWPQHVETLTLSAVDAGKSRAQSGVGTWSPFGGDYSEATSGQNLSELAIAGAHVRHRGS